MKKNQLITFPEAIKTDIIHALQENGIANATQIAKQITIDVSPRHARLELPAYLQFIKSTRRPVKTKTIQAKPPMSQQIMKRQREMIHSTETLAAIKQPPDKPGPKLESSIIAVPLGENNINHKLNPCLDGLAKEVSTQICDLLDQLNKQLKRF